MLGEGASGDGPAGAAAPLGSVFHNTQAQRRQVEHLTGLHPDDRRLGQLGAAPAAPVRSVLSDLVRLGDLGQVGAGGAGLLTRPAPLGSLIGPAFGPRGLAQPVRGRRLGGVGRVPAEPTFQLCHPHLQPSNQAGLLGVGRCQLSIGRAQLSDDRGLDRHSRFQIRVGGRDRGLQDTKRSSPLAHGPHGTAIPATTPPSNQPRRGDQALNSYSK
jgi:hypothetical protein